MAKTNWRDVTGTSKRKGPKKMKFSALLLFSATLHGEILFPFADTSIAEEAPNALHYDSSTTLYTIGVPGFRAYSLLRFDLTSLVGRDVSGDATLNLNLNSQFPTDTSTRSVSVWLLTQFWDSSTATWNSFGTSPGVQFGLETAATPLATVAANLSSEGPGYRSWAIPENVVQNWIDNPSGNRGVLVAMASTSDNPYYWSSSEGSSEARPFLAVNAVPEINAGLGGGFATIGLIGFSIWLHRKRQSFPKAQ
jgi:hypothetical protein